MVIEIKAYYVKCDRCSTVCRTPDNEYPNCSSQEAIYESFDDGWDQDGDKNYCPDCAFYNANDELIVKEPLEEILPF